MVLERGSRVPCPKCHGLGKLIDTPWVEYVDLSPLGKRVKLFIPQSSRAKLQVPFREHRYSAKCIYEFHGYWHPYEDRLLTEEDEESCECCCVEPAKVNFGEWMKMVVERLKYLRQSAFSQGKV